MKNYKLFVNTSSKKYPIIIGDKIAENLNHIFKLNKINKFFLFNNFEIFIRYNFFNFLIRCRKIY